MDERNILKIFHHKWFYSLHPGRIRLSLAVALAFLFFLPFAPSSGKVFWDRFLAKGASIFDPAGNWRQIYKCPMMINGARVSLSVYGCDDSLQSVMAKLKRNFSASQISRLLVPAMPDSDKSVIFEFGRQPNEFSKPPALSSASAVFGQSFPAGSTLTATIKNEETGATLETFASAAPPERVFNALSEHLSRDGWKNMLPDGNHNAARRYFQIYQRGHAVCAVMVGQAADRAGQALRENQTCVTILLKEINRQ